MTVPEQILALDFGSKRVGVAVAHVVARLPRPLTTLQNSETLLDDIRNLVNKEGAALVLVGLPRGMDGGYTEQTRLAEEFAHELASVLSVPIELVDETLTSVDAEQVLAQRSYNKGEVDALAASLILERYLAEHTGSEVHA